MITNLYSNLLTANPHLCYNFGTMPANEITYATPQSWPSQEIPLPQASWNLHIIAVWNTDARLHLKSHKPTWPQHLAQRTFLKHTGTLSALLMIPYAILDMLRQQLVSRSLRGFTQTKIKLPSAPTDLFVLDAVVHSAMAVLEHVKDEL